MSANCSSILKETNEYLNDLQGSCWSKTKGFGSGLIPFMASKHFNHSGENDNCQACLCFEVVQFNRPWWFTGTSTKEALGQLQLFRIADSSCTHATVSMKQVWTCKYLHSCMCKEKKKVKEYVMNEAFPVSPWNKHFKPLSRDGNKKETLTQRWKNNQKKMSFIFDRWQLSKLSTPTPPPTPVRKNKKQKPPDKTDLQTLWCLLLWSR